VAFARLAPAAACAWFVASCGASARGGTAPGGESGEGGAGEGGVGASSVSSAGTGGQSTAGAAGAATKPRTFCWDWSDLENQPKPGESGPAACPNFNELKFVVKRTCGYTVPDPTPIPADATAKGDCCYGVDDFYCR
jgi:hypothetical protein